MRAEVLEEMDTYISRRQNTVMEQIATWPIFDLCLEAEQRTGSQVPRRWWDQVGIYFAGL